MRLLLLLFLFPLFSAALSAQSDLEKLQKGHEILYHCRLSFNLNPPYIRGSIKEANELVQEVQDINALVANYPALAQKFNAEEFFLSYWLESIRPDQTLAAKRQFLSDAYKSADLALEKHQLKPEVYDQIGLTATQIKTLLIEIENLLPEYGLANIIKHNNFSSSDMKEFVPYEFTSRASNLLRMDESILAENATLGDIDEMLHTALRAKGYSENTYYRFGEGFALVTKMEQIDEEGNTMMGNRWLSASSNQNWTLWSYLKALVTANPSHYRVLVFVVSDEALRKNQKGIRNIPSISNASGSGDMRLAYDIAARRFTEQFSCTALVYEFSKSSREDWPELKLPDQTSITAEQHLKKAGLYRYFTVRP